jgi:hypothetical protein
MDAAELKKDDLHDKRMARLAREKAELERLRVIEAAARPFADHDWVDAELEDDNCQLTRHSGPVTVRHWKALRAALKPRL